MCDEEKSEDRDEDQSELHEVVSDCGDVRVRSGFEIEEIEPGQMGISIFGPIFDFLDDDEEEKPDEKDEEKEP